MHAAESTYLNVFTVQEFDAPTRDEPDMKARGGAGSVKRPGGVFGADTTAFPLLRSSVLRATMEMRFALPTLTPRSRTTCVYRVPACF